MQRSGGQTNLSPDAQDFIKKLIRGFYQRRFIGEDAGVILVQPRSGFGERVGKFLLKPQVAPFLSALSGSGFAGPSFPCMKFWVLVFRVQAVNRNDTCLISR